MTSRIVWLTGLFLLGYIAPLGIRPLFVPDETRYAEIPREMRITGDWVVPRFNGWDYFEKPVLGYWLIAVSQEVLGETPFAVRLPSALAAGVSALAILLLWGHKSKHPDAIAPVAAVALFLTTPLVYGCGTYAVLDGPFSAFVTLAMALFFRGDQELSPGCKRWYLAGFGVASGLAFLTKGLLGFVLPGLAIGAYLVAQRRIRDLLRLPWLPLIMAGAVVLPWAVAVHHRAPDFWRYFIWQEHIERFFNAGGSQHPEPFWYFLPVLLGGALPLVLLLPAAVAGLRLCGRSPLTRFCLLWFGVLFAFFSASSGKLGTYILPCIPPLAVLGALGTEGYWRAGKTRLFDMPAKALGLLLLVALWGFAALHILPFPREWKPYTWHELGPLLLGGIGVLTWAGALFGSTWPAPPVRRVAWFAAGPVLLMVLFPILLPPQALQHKAPLAMLERNAGQVQAKSWILTSPRIVGAVDWCFKRKDAWLVKGAGELAYGLARAPKDSRLVPVEKISDFVACHVREGQVILFVSARAFARYESELPDPVRVEREGEMVWAEYGEATGSRASADSAGADGIGGR